MRDVVIAAAKRTAIGVLGGELSALASATCPRVFVALDLDAEALLGLLDRCDAWRRPQRFQQLLQVCEACSLTPSPPGSASQARVFPQAEILRHALKAAQSVQAKAYLNQGITGRALGEAMREGRLERIRDILHALHVPARPKTV